MSAFTSAPRCAMLPKPFPTGTFTVGQLMTDPRKPESGLTSRMLSDRDYDDTRMTAWYKDIAALSSSGNFLKSLGGELLVQRPRRNSTTLVSIEAEKLSTRALKQPFAAFEHAVTCPAAAAFLRDAARARRPVYFVAATQELTNASYAHADAKDAGNGLVEVAREMQQPALDAKGRPVGGATRRRDSGFDEPTRTKTDVLGVEIREVRVKIGRVEVPHSTRDLQFRWAYVQLPDEDLQLAVGLGAALDQEELTNLWDDEAESDDDDDDDE